jgi:nitrate/TMAO reductase-like tetraheme cytochrome c subunit
MNSHFMSRVVIRPQGGLRQSLMSMLLGAAVVVAPFAVAEDGAEEGAEGKNVHETLYEGKGEKPYYPSASECKQCHPDHYREWAGSPHAYAQMSPVFNSMQATILKITNGTNGDFCIRCHTPVGMNLSEELFQSNIDRNPTSREGVTCVVCHRVNTTYGKISGRLALESGELSEAIFGPTGNKEFDTAFGQPITKKFGEGKVHGETKPFYQLQESSFCGTCHDVNLLNGFRLEEAFSEYKQSPASRNGVTCSDCHMGKTPGVFSGDKETNYDTKQIAKIGAKWVGEERRKTNHRFPGPDHSVIHPGIFPHNDDAAQFASIREWLTFDFQAGWGTEQFEEEEEPAREEAGKGTAFPKRWDNIDERYEARDIIAEQIKQLEVYQEERVAVLKAGYGLGDFEVKKASAKRGVEFTVGVKNLTDGHNVPTGFIAERMLFLQVSVTDPSGEQVFISGDLDPNYDVRDLHSLFVHNGDLSLDQQLFSLQSTFLVRNNRGTEREQVLPLNFSPSPLPFLRPSRFSATLIGRPGGARIHRRGITPLHERKAKYRVGKKKLNGSGTYNVNVKMIAGMIPVNLVDDIKGVGFDYGMSAHEIALGVRFGVGDVVDAEGNRYNRNHIAQLIEEHREEELKDLFGLTGGHTLIAEENFEFNVE